MRVIKLRESVLWGVLFLFSMPTIAMEIPNVPKVPAFLPTVDQVPASQIMPIDGTWLVPSLGKKIRIDSGRAYAVDGWLHLFVLDIQPGMVVLKDLTPSAPGQYVGEDLPLMGKLTAKVLADKSISVTVAGIFGSVSYKLIPVQINNLQWYQQEMQAAGLITQNFNPNQQSSYQQSYQMSPPPNSGSMRQQNNGQQNYHSGGQSYGGNYQQPPRQYYSNQQPTNQYQPPRSSSQFNEQEIQTSNPGSHETPETEPVCEEEVYDPETDTTSCYQEGRN